MDHISKRIHDVNMESVKNSEAEKKFVTLGGQRLDDVKMSVHQEGGDRSKYTKSMNITGYKYGNKKSTINSIEINPGPYL